MTALRINRSAYAIAADLVSEGRWRVDPSTGDVFGVRGRPLRRTDAQGYRQTEIRVGQSRVSVYLHRVVWESVHGAIPDGLQLNHIDGVKTNNAIANLELVTQSENNLHAHRTGLAPSVAGARNPRAILTEDDVRSIAARAVAGEDDVAIAADFGVSRQVVSHIRSGRTWRSVTSPGVRL
jgi:hypothetical protein